MSWFKHKTTTEPPPDVELTRDEPDDRYQARRHAMVQEQIVRRGISDTRVLSALAAVPRHLFVPAASREAAYEDHPIPIGWGQTISQPYIVAFMTAAAELPEHARVLEIGTGSGYQTAVLAHLGAEVFSLEIVPELAMRARELLDQIGYTSVEILERDGYAGLPEAAPFDAILCAAAPLHVPDPLLTQLKVGGRLVMPVGQGVQYLKVITRGADGWSEENGMPVRFVPMTGQAESQQ